MSIRSLRSPATHWNKAVQERKRQPDEDNAAWLRRVLGERGLIETGPAWSMLLLVGGKDPLSFRLRVAQSHVRHDLTPSAWSHVAFVPRLADPIGDSPVREVSLAPQTSFGEAGFPVPTNGLQEGRLAAYLSRGAFENIALLSIPVPAEQIGETLDRLQLQRSLLDVPQLILRWLAYCWGVGVPGGPLAEGLGIPGAAVLEAAFSARGFDLTPGLESRSSCPEAIWQAARWWHEYYARTFKPADTQPRGARATPASRAITGAYSALHDLVPEAAPGRTSPATPKAAGPRRGRPRRRRTR